MWRQEATLLSKVSANIQTKIALLSFPIRTHPAKLLNCGMARLHFRLTQSSSLRRKRTSATSVGHGGGTEEHFTKFITVTTSCLKTVKCHSLCRVRFHVMCPSPSTDLSHLHLKRYAAKALFNAHKCHVTPHIECVTKISRNQSTDIEFGFNQKNRC
jgi:hypothetical protein